MHSIYLEILPFIINENHRNRKDIELKCHAYLNSLENEICLIIAEDFLEV